MEILKKLTYKQLYESEPIPVKYHDELRSLRIRITKKNTIYVADRSIIRDLISIEFPQLPHHIADKGVWSLIPTDFPQSVQKPSPRILSFYIEVYDFLIDKLNYDLAKMIMEYVIDDYFSYYHHQYNKCMRELKVRVKSDRDGPILSTITKRGKRIWFRVDDIFSYAKMKRRLELEQREESLSKITFLTAGYDIDLGTINIKNNKFTFSHQKRNKLLHVRPIINNTHKRYINTIFNNNKLPNIKRYD